MASVFRLLCITAHPDDEAGAFGGTLLRYAERGVATFVVCLTPGQAGRHRGGARSPAELIAMRRAEFAASCAVLRVTRGEVLGYDDAKLPLVPFLDAVGAVVGSIRRIRPQVVLTYGPEGGLTGHPDHSMAGIWATAAFHWAARADRFPEQITSEAGPHRAQKLYYASALFGLAGRPPVAPAPVTCAVDIAAYREGKIRAFRQHLSQAPLFDIFEKNISGHGDQEVFHLAAAATPCRVEIEDDLFAGVAAE